MTISTATLCPYGHNVELSQPYGNTWQAICDCYDGAEDAGPQLYAHGPTPEAALDAFVEQAEELSEAEYWPRRSRDIDPLFGLGWQVNAESRLAIGWRVIDGVYGPVAQPSAAAG